MKLVTAIIKPFKLDDVRTSLSEIGVQGITVTEVKGFGRQRGHTELYRGAEYDIALVPKIRVEIIVADEDADTVLEAITRSDIPLIVAYLMVVGLIFVVTNTLVDLIYGLVNPTVKLTGKKA